MSQAILDRLSAEREQIAEFVSKTLEAVDGRDLSETELRSINDSKARIGEIDAQVAPLAAFMTARNSATDLTAIMNRSMKPGPQVETRSMGQAFVESEIFKSYPGRGTSSRMTYETRALPMTLTTQAGGLPPRQKIDFTPAPAPTVLLDLIDTIPVSQNAFDSVVWAKVAGGADVVAEGGPKPSAEWAPTVTTLTLATIAVYTQMTRQLIEDAPAVAAKIDTELRREVENKMESEAAAALVAATLPTATGATLLEAIRVGVGTVQAAGYNPNAVLLNPADWAALDIQVFGATLLGPAVGGRYWGLTPIASNAQTAGTATVGDFSAGVQRYARNGISLYVTDSHASTFTSNIFTTLAEGRAKTIVTRPAALVECTETVGTATAAEKK